RSHIPRDQFVEEIIMSKKVSLMLPQKLEVLDRVKKEPPETSLRELARRLNVKKSMLADLVANEQMLCNTATTLVKGDVGLHKKRKCEGKDPEVDHALLMWLQRASIKGLPLNGPILKAKAESLAHDLGKSDFFATDGWFSRWKVRHNIMYKRAHGELKSADLEGADYWSKTKLQELLSSYNAEDIYNADETGLYYRATPDSSMVFCKTVLSRLKKAMDRITLLVCANMNGSDRRKLLVIGKSQCPCCMKGVNPATLPVTYKSNKTAWMTGAIFEDWLTQWDKELVRKGRMILVLVDNALSHPSISTLKNICLQMIPLHTSLIQPMDQRVIRNLKHYYHDIISTQATVAEVAHHITLLDAIGMAARAWDSLKPATISNCFRKAGF
uniref:HTH CENPB-type domain-containing protein n=1 Tax=Latimeria chalumnae TaxID=7897 RepID=H3AH01_LATCH